MPAIDETQTFAARHGRDLIAIDPYTRLCNCFDHSQGRRVPKAFAARAAARKYFEVLHGRLWIEIHEIVRLEDAQREWRQMAQHPEQPDPWEAPGRDAWKLRRRR